MKIPYYHVDAFTGELFGGNPAGVCILSAFLSDTMMQEIAAENRHSETAFVVHRDDANFDLRWFTPKVEDDLCGHATLAAAYVLALRNHHVWPVYFHTRSGVLAVDRDADNYQLEFPTRPPHRCDEPIGLLAALGLTSAKVMRSTRDYLVIVENTELLRALSPDISALARIDMGIGGTIVTAPGYDNIDYVCRFFPPSVGIDEDPATGSIQCTLAPYWADKLSKRSLNVAQLSTRGAFMQCDVDGGRVKIAGHARLYLHGTIEL